MRYRYALIVMLSACAVDPVEGAPTPTAETALIAPPPAAPTSCAAVVSGAVPVGGGNTSCQMTVTITVTCPHGQTGRAVAVFGESGGPTLFAASLDAAYQCGVPVVAGRYGIDCGNTPAADVVWYAPDGTGPTTCAQ